MSNAFTKFFAAESEAKAKPHDPAISYAATATPSASASQVSIKVSLPDSINSHYAERAAATQDTILSRPAPSIHRGTKQKFSKKIQLTNNADTMAAVCDVTGSVVAVTFPHIPGRVFSYISPLSILSNCRGIAQEGRNYMRKLDTQTLAAILITLSDDYDLFRYQPSDSGAQKNAILRTVAKDILIDAILMIEDFVNSTNCFFLPKLSLIFDQQVEQNGIQVRFQSWTALCMEAIQKPDLRTEEEIGGYKKPVNTQTTRYAKKEQVAFNKEFREWKRDSKLLITSMFAKQQISSKLRDFLLTIVSNDNLAMADTAMVDLICSKLHQLNLMDASMLANKITTYKIRLNDMNDSSDLFAEPTSFAKQSIGSSLEPQIDKQAEKEAKEQKSVDVAQESPKGMSILERIKAKKASEKLLTVSNLSKAGENNDAPF